MPAPSPLVQELIDYHFPDYPSVTGLLQPITLHSLGEFLWAAIWACLLLVSFTGWGRLSGRLLCIRSLPASAACAAGVAVVVFLGGFLNLFDGISSAALFTVVILGLVLYAAQTSDRPAKYRWSAFWGAAAPWAKVLMVAALLVVLMRAAATVRLAEFDINDDSAAYLAFPLKMLATHHFAADPFSDRRIISSLGGGYLLQAIAIAATSLANIGMADRTLGLLLLFPVLWDLGVAFGLSFEQIACFEFAVCLIPQQTSNLTFVVLPVSILLSMMWFIFETSSQQWRSAWRGALLAGSIGGAAVTLKSTFLPCVGAFCLFPFLLLNWRHKKNAILLPLIAGIGALLVVAPWMIAMKHLAGTYLYPILGRGTDYSSYKILAWFQIARTSRTIIKLFLHAVALFALLAALLSIRIRNQKALFAIGVLIASAFGITAFNIASGGDSIWRYDFPAYFSTIIVYSIACIALSREPSPLRNRRMALTLGILSLLSCIIYYDISGARPELLRQSKWEVSRYSGALHASLSGLALSSPAVVGEYRAIDEALPRDGAALEDVGYPFLLNDKTHRIFLMDWPGAAAPSPGWPFGASPATLAHYLQQHSVRYLIFDYRYARWMDAKSCQVLELKQNYSTELYVLFWMSLLAQNQFRHLHRDYQAIYDDGKIAVIDLSRPLENTPAKHPVWTFDTTTDAICTTSMKRYLSDPLPADTR